jgi:hypothetical protein
VQRVVYGNKTAHDKVGVTVANENTIFGSENFVVRVHRHNIGVAGDQPIRPKRAVSAVVDRVFRPQAIKERPMGIRSKASRIRNIDFVQRCFRSLFTGPVPAVL